ncbi:Hypothetical predicted protein [Paramuricea clavata]|uniref:Uncharacterized protein n=1 Tax=Paramuricea clavata TaxID=317549 RepID=A0A6S7K0Q5_PARCT|nr:Hypothetical predicted protein [Paramuricea clavata]
MTEKMVRGRDCPWLTTEIKSKIKERDFFLRKARKSEMTTDWLAYKKLRNTVTQDIRRSKANYNRSLFSENINSPTQFWNQIKKCYPAKEKKLVTSKVFDIDETTTTDKTSIANGFCKYFTNVGKTLQTSLITLGNTVWENHDHKKLSKRINQKELQFTFEKVSASNMVKLLRQLKASKASGYDGIPTSMIKDGAEELAVPLTYLINSCLEQSVFPDTEKYAKIIPVYKSGKRSSMDNYRPISILPVLSKVFERVVQKQLYEYLEKNSLLSPNQFAFRKHRSTQHPVTLLSDHIRGHMDKGELTGAVYIDLRKAFDTIDHGRLLSKLPCYGIRGRELIWLENYLFGRKQFVVFDSATSEGHTVLTGVPQGSVLGPLLFVLLINDIDLQMQNCQILLYADDTVVYTSDKSCEAIESNLNSELTNLARWFSNNKLVLNLKKGKTEFVLFGTSKKLRKSPKVQVKINEIPINEAESYEYLGVELDKSLNYNSHIDRTIKKASAKVKLLSRIRQNVSPYVAEKIYKVMIESTLGYCGNLFLGISNSTANRFQQIQDRAINIVYGTNVTPNRWCSIRNVRKLHCVQEVFKCLNGLVPNQFNGIFNKFSHQKETRGNNSKLRLPKVKTETGRKMFSFQGALVFNELPEDLRNETSLLRFKQKCRNFFMKTD